MSKQLLKEIGDLIYNARVKQRKYKNRIAADASMNNSQYGKIESGQVDMQISTLEKIANALNVPLVELIPTSNKTIRK